VFRCAENRRFARGKPAHVKSRRRAVSFTHRYCTARSKGIREPAVASPPSRLEVATDDRDSCPAGDGAWTAMLGGAPQRPRHRPWSTRRMPPTARSAASSQRKARIMRDGANPRRPACRRSSSPARCFIAGHRRARADVTLARGSPYRWRNWRRAHRGRCAVRAPPPAGSRPRRIKGSGRSRTSIAPSQYHQEHSHASAPAAAFENGPAAKQIASQFEQNKRSTGSVWIALKLSTSVSRRCWPRATARSGARSGYWTPTPASARRDNRRVWFLIVGGVAILSRRRVHDGQPSRVDQDRLSASRFAPSHPGAAARGRAESFALARAARTRPQGFSIIKPNMS
jgi:hypothetical protein